MDHLSINHIGFLCHTEKKVIIPKGPWTKFFVQDMSRNSKENLGEYENWEIAYTGQLQGSQTEMGEFLTGDFSEIRQPGIYRIVLPDETGHSFQFTISDGIFHPVIRMFLDFVHNWRSGDFSNAWRGPSHLDDAIHSDNGRYLDVSGGWYDAGDTRKWMTMSTLPVIAFLDILQNLKIKWNHFAEEKISDNDLITEAVWGIRFILKMQDQETGMIYEEVGAGGDARKKSGMSWWYENHSGCLADNSQNHFTDNRINSGDERTIRAEYNPIVQYTNLYILLRSAEALKCILPDMAQHCRKSAEKIWNFMKSKRKDDPLHSWTSVRSWQLMAAIELKNNGLITSRDLSEIVEGLLQNRDEKTGFWYMDISGTDPYRGILHSAQPLIALCRLLDCFPDFRTCRQVIAETWEQYIRPLSATNPFGIIPYGTYFLPATEKDHYRKLKNGQHFRFFMPDNSSQRINHGLGGHWTSWAHALAMMGRLFKNPSMTNLAWKQLYWLWGNNPMNVCLVSGLGFNNPMPHSRFLGTFPGGFCVGPRGDLNDDPVIDMMAKAEWNSTEYWLTPLSNALMALAQLVPEKVDVSNKLGVNLR